MHANGHAKRLLGLGLAAVATAFGVAHRTSRAGEGEASSASTHPAATTQPTTGPAVVSDAELDQLILGLAARDWRARERSQQRLSEIDTPAESRLERFLHESSDPEAIARAAATLAHLSSRHKLVPTLVSAHFDKTPAKDVFAELSKQTKLSILPHQETLWQQRDWPAVTLEARNEPFWAVIRKACAVTGIRPLWTGADNEPGRVELVNDVLGDMTAPAAFSGPFMMLVSDVARRPNLADVEAGGDPPGKNPATETAQVQITFFADPKWRIVDHPEEATVELATDDQNRPLHKPAPLSMAAAFKPDAPVWVMRTSVNGIPAGCPKLANFRGHFQIEVLEQADPIEVRDVMKAHNVSFKIGRQMVELTGVTKEDDVYHVQLILSRNGLTDQDWRQAREVEGIGLFDATGRPFSRSSFDARDVCEQVAYELEFVDPNAPAPNAQGAVNTEHGSPPERLTFRLPLESRTITVPFQFSDLAIGQ